MAGKKPVKRAAKRATRSKAELSHELEDVQASVEAHEEPDEISGAAAAARASHVRDTVKGVTIESAAQAIATAKIKTSLVLDEVGSAIFSAVQQLQEVKEARELEEKEIEELHGKEVIAASRKAMLAEFTEVYATKLEEQAEQDKQRELASQEALRALKAQQEETQRIWKREQDTYQYNLSQERKKESDAHAEHRRQQQLVETDRVRELEANWAAREKALKAQEQAHVDLQAEVAAHPEILRKAVSQAEAIVGHTLKRDHGHALEIINTNHASALALSGSEKKALEAQIVQQKQQITDLQHALADANKAIHGLGEKALDAASSQGALSALQQAQSNGRELSAKKSS